MIMIWACAHNEVRETSSQNVIEDKKQSRGVVHGTEKNKKSAK